MRNNLTLKKKANKGLRAVDKDIQSGGADSILAMLFRKISQDNDINPIKFNSLMELYLSDRRNGIPQNTKDRASARGNFRKELLKPNMSWKVFCKGLRFLNIRSFDITLDVKDENDNVTKHGTTVYLGEPIIDTYIEPYKVLEENFNVLEGEFKDITDKLLLEIKMKENNGNISVIPIKIENQEMKLNIPE